MNFFNFFNSKKTLQPTKLDKNKITIVIKLTDDDFNLESFILNDVDLDDKKTKTMLAIALHQLKERIVNGGIK